MAITRSQLEMARRIAHENPDIDTTLPIWARRTNPIIRRRLGMYWRVFPPQIGPIARWAAIESLFILLSIPYPLLFVVILTFLLAALMMLPYAFYLYVRTLGYIINDASVSLVQEFQNETMTLLRTTPMTTMEIFLSKVSAAFWRRVDELDQILSFGLALGMPPIILFYLSIWPPDEYVALPQIMAIIMFAASLIRVPLEMFMVASVGGMLGIYTRLRSTAFLGTAAFTFFYFLLLNLMRLLHLSWPVQIIVDSVLPVVLPLLIIYGSAKLAVHLVMRD